MKTIVEITNKVNETFDNSYRDVLSVELINYIKTIVLCELYEATKENDFDFARKVVDANVGWEMFPNSEENVKELMTSTNG